MMRQIFTAILLLLCLSIGADAQVITGGNPTTLTWDGPSENDDGTPLTDLAGYKVYYGRASRTYGPPVDVRIPESCGPFPHKGCTYVIPILTPKGQYFFAVTAYDSTGSESAYSNEVTKIVKTAPKAPGCSVK